MQAKLKKTRVRQGWQRDHPIEKKEKKNMIPSRWRMLCGLSVASARGDQRNAFGVPFSRPQLCLQIIIVTINAPFEVFLAR